MGSKLFHNPVNENYTISSPKRKSRPFQEDVSCPFCTGSEEIPEEFEDVRSLPNKFPALYPSAETGEDGLTAKGICEVIVYSSNHYKSLVDRPISFVDGVIKHWIRRTNELKEKYKFLRYIFPFENYGRSIGVSLDHPHGQLYALSIIPPIIRRKQKNLQRRSCKLCNLQEEDFITIQSYGGVSIIVPKSARWPLEVQIVTKDHYNILEKLDSTERRDVAKALKNTLKAFHSIYNQKIPYITSVYQAPIDQENGDFEDFHCHIEVISPQITENKLKYRAGLETSLDIFINSTAPEDIAMRIKENLGE